jgi:hypothetical protein
MNREFMDLNERTGDVSRSRLLTVCYKYTARGEEAGSVYHLTVK